MDAPLPGHAALRDAGPYVWLSRYDIGAVARYEQVRAVLADWKTFSSARGVGMEDFEVHGRFRLPSLILEADPPEHSVSRDILSRVLSPLVLKTLRERFFEEADLLVSELLERRTFDGIKDLAEAYPLRVFPDAIGMSRDGREKLLPHADMLFNSFGPRNALFQASADKANFAWVDQQGRREMLQPGGLGMMVHDAAERKSMPPEKAAMLVRALLQAGLDTTINGLGATLHCLLQAPDQWLLLRQDPSLARAAFDEAIRLESPVQTFFRTATRDTTLGEIAVNSGDKVLMFLGAANRDPRQWAAPDRYDIMRRTIGHVGFGAGIHACVGQLLSKLEAEALLSTFARRVRSMEMTASPERRYNNTLRGLATLPVAIR
ncbi:cytochrome P450 [Sphingobium sp.]|uniref:cytochrome P450 n=1 Tax=Sphingobium sp. TaxID=1912891 RepID=UPI0028BE310B|nr:cytochrome P450 [Sphingobium sp.]